MMGRPQFDGDCLGCTRCVSICPGLAITIVDKEYDKSKKTARVIVPWEMPKGTVKIGQNVTTTGMEGEIVGNAKIIGIKQSEWQNRRTLLSLEVPMKDANLVAGIQIKKITGKTVINKVKTKNDDEIVVCRCERVTKKDIKNYIKKTGTRDINAVKAALRVGMGPCGGKTCTELVMRVFRELGIDLKEVNPPIERPFTQEVPLKAFLKKEEEKWPNMIQ